MGEEVFHGGDNLGHAGFVVGPQEGGTVGDDQVVAHIPLQALVLSCSDDIALGLVQHHIAAPVLNDPGVDMAPGVGGGSVHVGDQPHAGKPLTAGGCGKSGVDIAILIHAGVPETQAVQLGGQEAAQLQLLGGGGAGLRALVGLGVKGDIFQKTIHKIHKINFLS